MKRRKAMRKSIDKRIFRRTANRTRVANVARGTNKRGGGSL